MNQQGGGGRGPNWPGGPPQQYPPQQPYYPQQPAYPPQQPYGQQQPPYPQQPQQPMRPSGAGIGVAFRRAFRMRIDPSEVTQHEREKLEAAGVRIPAVQAFLAWRRSLLTVVILGLIPAVVLEIAGMAGDSDLPDTLKTLNILGVSVNVLFVVILVTQLGRWTQWRKQRRTLTVAWLIYFLAPFVIWLYPIKLAFEEQIAVLGQQAAATGDPAQAALATVMGSVLGLGAALVAMMQLAPKAVSIMPGILRGAITSKLLFPGASGPGWLVLLMAPIYAILMYVVLMLPYQLTGSGYFVAAMVGLIGAQLWMGRMGYRLARPESFDEALALVRRVRAGYLLLNLAGLAFIAAGMWTLVKTLDLAKLSVVHTLFSFLVNVLLLTLIATDNIVANLARGQRQLIAPGVANAQAIFQRDVSAFVDPEVSSGGQGG
ncbi:MAG TPA: hypothetical protein VMZ28_14065 [Kofleriaceae bacterium]|nr:hypothetical protein [Kofleriaceae bacterium]